MRSVGVGLAFLATAMMVAGPALAEDKSSDAKPAKETAAAPAAPAAKTGNVTVHLESPQTVSLERRTGADAWEHVCNSPCDASVSVNDEYRIVGTDLNPSKGFLLDASQGDKVTVNVTPGSKKSYTTGLWILGGGAVLGVGGAVTILAGASNKAVPGNDGVDTSSKNTNIIALGTVLILGGVAAAITGGAMAVDNAHTQVGGSVATPQEKRDDKKGPLSVQVTASRTPTWHQSEGPAPTPAFVVPVLSGAF